MQPSRGTVRSMRPLSHQERTRSSLGLDGSAAKVERNLDGAGAVLGGEGGERIPPLVERERVGEHPVEVDAAGGDKVEIVLDPVALNTIDLLEAERVRTHPGDLLEVERRPLPAGGPV